MFIHVFTHMFAYRWASQSICVCVARHMVFNDKVVDLFVARKHLCIVVGIDLDKDIHVQNSVDVYRVWHRSRYTYTCISRCTGKYGHGDIYM